MEMSRSYYQGLLIKNHTVNGYDVCIFKLSHMISAYLLECSKERYQLYINNTEKCGELTLLATFKTKDEGIDYAISKWADNEGVIKFGKYFDDKRYTPATAKQIRSTQGTAQTYEEVMWYFAQRSCYFALKGTVSAFKALETKARNKQLYNDLLKDLEPNYLN